MFTVADIKVRAEQLVSDAIDDVDAVDWINDGLHEIGEKIWPEETAHITAESKVFYGVPKDFIMMIQVQRKGIVFRNYQIRNDKIAFSQDGEYELIYRAHFPHAESVLDQINLSNAYILPLVKYMMAKQLYQNKEFDLSFKAESEFRDSVSSIIGTAEYTNKPFRVRTNF